MRQGGPGLDGLIRSGDGVPELYFCQVVEALLWPIPSGWRCFGGRDDRATALVSSASVMPVRCGAGMDVLGL